MKSLLEIQQEIRNIEKSLSDTSRDISQSIKRINSDIDDLRSVGQKKSIDYSKIEMLSKNFSFENHPIGSLNNESACRLYLEMLLNMVHIDLDDELTVNRLVFIQWLQKEAHTHWSLEDLYKDCYALDISIYYELPEMLPISYREFLAVDLLIAANIGGAANAEINEYIADIITILGIEKDDLKILSLIAKSALSQSSVKADRSGLSGFLSKADSFRHYINSDIIDTGLNDIRKLVVSEQRYVSTFEWIAKQGQAVKKGETIAMCNDFLNSKGPYIKAPCDGTLFKFETSITYYGVISYEADNMDSIKKWVEETERQYLENLRKKYH